MFGLMRPTERKAWPLHNARPEEDTAVEPSNYVGFTPMEGTRPDPFMYRADPMADPALPAGSRWHASHLKHMP